MKMIGFNGFTLGLILLLLGIVILIKVIFKIDIPLFRILFGALLIYFGILFITGKSNKSCKKEYNSESYKTTDNNIIFSNGTFQFQPDKTEYNTIFSKSFLDLSNIDTTTLINIETNAIFSDMQIKLNREKPFNINAHAVFGNVQTPDGNQINFGNNSFKSSQENAATLNINASAVFGQITFIY